MNKKWKCPGRRSKYDGLYKSWRNMILRAGNKDGKNPTYADVTVCERWYSYDNFFSDMHESWFKGATIDKDSIKLGNRVYCKEYCQWMTQSNNSKEMISRLGNPMQSPEVARKHGLTMLGNQNRSKKVRCLETGEIFDSTVFAERKYNLKRGAVSKAANVNNKQKTAGKLPDGTKLHWKYEDENEEE